MSEKSGVIFIFGSSERSRSYSVRLSDIVSLSQPDAISD